MGSSAVAAARSPSRKEVIIGFDAEKLRAPFFLRCGAAIIDYLIVIFVPVCGLLLSRLLGNDGARLVNSEINNFAWLLATLVAICNLILLPAVIGQSLGKVLTGLRVACLGGEPPNIGTIVLRQTFGYLLTLGSGGLGFLLSVFSSKGRALHDYVAGTVVVYANTKIRS